MEFVTFQEDVVPFFSLPLMFCSYSIVTVKSIENDFLCEWRDEMQITKPLKVVSVSELEMGFLFATYGGSHGSMCTNRVQNVAPRNVGMFLIKDVP